MSKLPTLQLGKISTSKSLFSQMWGLRLSKPKLMAFHLSKPQNVLMDNILVFYPINLYFLDQGKKVIEIKRNFKPFTFYKTQTKPNYIIESPKPLNIQLGQEIEWE